jgi:hypothetical protein
MHLHLASRDHAVSRRFYETYFGFRFDAESPRRGQAAATVLRSPRGFQIYLDEASAERLPAWFHFGFLAESQTACFDLYARMRRDSVTIVRPLVLEPFASYLAADPDGHVLQVYFDPHAPAP